ncbi:MAG: response regulator transcription factor [Phaeodactylibacter sp.]|nr:response regulator transcription factor [Phaeodactylibacter sp.]MCB9275838.1 response regulator transcription factor [Lewinellaceae bacterium]
MTITCFIIDDEPPAIRVLERYIAQTPYLELIGSATNPLEGMQAIQSKQPQLLFLDINMPKLSGISLLRSLPTAPGVIFTTAYPEYALEGFELEAIDYLLKPFSLERFLKAVNKAMKLILPRDNSYPDTAFLALKSGKKLFRVAFDNILFLEAYGDYVKVYTAGEVLVTKTTLAQLEEGLPPTHFLRTHRSFIISLQHIKYLEGNFVLVGSHKVPIGRAFRESVLLRISRR